MTTSSTKRSNSLAMSLTSAPAGSIRRKFEVNSVGSGANDTDTVLLWFAANELLMGERNGFSNANALPINPCCCEFELNRNTPFRILPRTTQATAA